MVRRITGSKARFDLSVETADVDAYWSFWLDGAGSDVRLRLNLRHASFTRTRARQFALHEVLGHGLQCASIARQCAENDVPWVRVQSVHGPQEVASEGLPQAMPLYVAPDDHDLVTCVRLVHYVQLVRATSTWRSTGGTPSKTAPDTPGSTSPSGTARTSPISSPTGP